MAKTPTIRDVARVCGCSHMTVSHVINNGSVSTKTRAHVLEAMRQLNYQPSAIARGLNRKPMDTLGVVLPHSYGSPMAHPYYAPVLDGIMSAAVFLNKDVTFYTSSLWHEGGEGLRRYVDGRTDGLVLLTPMGQRELVQALMHSPRPFVCVGPYWEELKFSYVCNDDAQSEMRRIEHLVNLGHRRIGFMCGHPEPEVRLPRDEGYRSALTSAGIAPDESLVWRGGFMRATVKRHVETIMDTPAAKRPTAICAYNDDVALTLIAELKNAGLDVPRDMSVMGFDDTYLAAEAQLTTMRQPLRDIGARAARMLVDILTGDINEPRRELFEAELIVRATTMPPG
jgi:DNA-binding LacI/PurR family transcriptional regulator